MSRTPLSRSPHARRRARPSRSRPGEATTAETRGRRRWWPSWRVVRWLLLVLVALLALGSAGVAVAAYVFWPKDLPPVKALEEYAPSVGTKVYADDDELLTEFQAERRIFVPLREMPPLLRNAVIAVEDARFYSHFGVDLRGIARAVYTNFRHGRVVEGGSTITQQLAKVLFLTPDRSISRKLKEALLALELEKRYSKDRLLELYLNQIYMGHGAYGVEAASRTFFGKSIQELRLPEVALLAALPRAPGSYSPFEHPELAQKRRSVVLARMVELGYVSEEEARRANRAPLGLVAPDRRRGTGQYFLEYLQQSLEAKFGSDLLYKGGLSVYTTLNSSTQRAAERALREGLHTIGAREAGRAAPARPTRPGRSGAKAPPSDPPRDRDPEGAAVVIEPQTGYIRALVGGSDFARSEFNRAILARRQAGSAFKPFVYLAALEAGLKVTDTLDDSPVRYTAGGRLWAPENYDNKYLGPVTLQEALEQSRNVPTVRLAERLGIGRVIDVARRLGIQSPLPNDLTLALGSGDVTLLELTSAYATLANQGIRMEPIAVRHVTDSQGRLIEENIPQGKQVVDPATVATLTQMLRGVVEHDQGTGVGARVLGRPLAAKTGTTNDYSNAWFLGYTPTLAAGVWVGHDRVRSLGADETGARAALPIWVAMMREAFRDRPVDDFPAAEAPAATPAGASGDAPLRAGDAWRPASSGPGGAPPGPPVRAQSER